MRILAALAIVIFAATVNVCLGELLICPQFREFSVSCDHAAMRDLLILFIHLITSSLDWRVAAASVP